MMNAQEKLINLTEKSLGENPNKKKLVPTLKLMYREYDKLKFINETYTPDFMIDTLIEEIFE